MHPILPIIVEDINNDDEAVVENDTNASDTELESLPDSESVLPCYRSLIRKWTLDHHVPHAALHDLMPIFRQFGMMTIHCFKTLFSRKSHENQDHLNCIWNTLNIIHNSQFT